MGIARTNSYLISSCFIREAVLQVSHINLDWTPRIFGKGKFKNEENVPNHAFNILQCRLNHPLGEVLRYHMEN